MSKRGDTKFERKGRDYYPTIDPAAVRPLNIYYEGYRPYFYEPCVGDGHLVDLLRNSGWGCTGGSDLTQHPDYPTKDATKLTWEDIPERTDYFVTNPPFKWEIFDPIADHLIGMIPTWMLLPADFMHNKRSVKYMNKCQLILSVGRLYWEPNKVKGTDNFCWYLFDKNWIGPVHFIPRYL